MTGFIFPPSIRSLRNNQVRRGGRYARTVRELSFEAKLERDKDGTWWYVRVPSRVRDSLKAFEKRGIIRVTATIGDRRWDGSVLPWADGSGQLSIAKPIRSELGLQLGQTIHILVRPRV